MAPPVRIYTDGSYCSYKGLGFPCGWAAVFPNATTPKKPNIISGHALNLPDSGSAEIMAVTKALESMPHSSHVEFYIDNHELATLVERYSKMPDEKKKKLRIDYQDEGNKRITRDRGALVGMFDALDQHTAGATSIRAHQSNAHEHHYYNNIADKAAKEARKKAYTQLDLAADPQKRSAGKVVKQRSPDSGRT
jgi:ribonuclease HI